MSLLKTLPKCLQRDLMRQQAQLSSVFMPMQQSFSKLYTSDVLYEASIQSRAPLKYSFTD